MKVILRKYSNGETSVSMSPIDITHGAATVTSEKEIEVQKSVIEGFFKSPGDYNVDFKKGEIHANT